jgi:hypothetical protein
MRSGSLDQRLAGHAAQNPAPSAMANLIFM